MLRDRLIKLAMTLPMPDDAAAMLRARQAFRNSRIAKRPQIQTDPAARLFSDVTRQRTYPITQHEASEAMAVRDMEA